MSVPMRVARASCRSAAESRRNELGQAMIECVVSAGVLSALFLGVLYIGRLHDVQSAVIQASRAAAFDVALSGPQAAERAPDRVAAHLLSWRTSVPRVDDSLREVPQARWLSALLDHTGREPLLAGASSLVGSLGIVPLPGAAEREMQVVFGAMAPAQALTGRTLELRREGWIQSRFAADLRATRAARPWLGIERLTLANKTVVAAFDWGAAGPEHVASRTSALVPAASGFIRDVVGPALRLARPLEPSLSGLCLGRIDPEVVPDDRVAIDASAPRGIWRAPC